MLKLRFLLKPYWVAVCLAPLMMILEVSMDLLQPKLMADIVNEGIQNGDLAFISESGILMFGIAIVGLITGAGCTYFSTKASQGFGTDLRLMLFERTQTLSFRQLDEFETGTLITRLTGDVTQLQQLVQMSLRVLVRNTFLLIGSVVMMIVISPRLSLILALSLPLFMLILIVLLRMSTPLFATLQSKLDQVNTVLQENTSGIRVIKSFVRADFEAARFAKANTDYRNIGIRAARVAALNMPLMTLILNLSIVAVLWYGGAQTHNGSLNIGDLAAFISYMTQMLFALLSIGMLIVTLSKDKASADRIREVLQTEPDVTYPSPSNTPHIQRGRIEFKEVYFSYDTSRSTEETLDNINVTIEAGQTVGILGSTGSGKSTLVSLAARMYEPDRGHILIDGVDLGLIDAHQLRRKMSLVLQQTILFSGTIRDNIRYGNPEAAEADIIAAAKAAEAHDFISQLPSGYDTTLGQRGVNLSGGQKQRIALARSFLLKPVILMLDDSTSAIDLGTESRIQQSLQRMMKEVTCLIIAQRISSVMHADQIIVMDQGRIAAIGTHDTLLRTSHIYQDIYNSQYEQEVG